MERNWPHLRYVVMVTATVFAVWATMAFLGSVIDIIFLTFLGLLIALILDYPIEWMSRFMPRVVAVLVTLVALIGIIAGMVIMTMPILQDQAARISVQAPIALQKIQEWWDSTKLPDIRGTLKGGIAELNNQIVPFVTGAVSAVAGLVVLIIMALFLAYDPRAYVNGALKLLPKRLDHDARKLVERIGTSLSRWMVGTLIAMTIVGTLTGIGALIIGLKSWLVLGLLAFFGEFVPYVGPIASAIPGVLVGLAISPETAVWTLVMYMAVQQLESNLITPLIMKRAIDLHPALVLVWQLVIGAGFGLIGLLIATPLLAVLKVSIDYLYVERMLHRPPSVAPD